VALFLAAPTIAVVIGYGVGSGEPESRLHSTIAESEGVIDGGSPHGPNISFTCALLIDGFSQIEDQFNVASETSTCSWSLYLVDR
jgi:hypothetical protein